MSQFNPLLVDLTGDNFAFVTNVLRLVNATSFTVAENHQLRRATAEEIPVIRETVKRLQTFPLNPWEQRIDGGRVETMQEADWLYHVISFRGPSQTIAELEQAFGLAPLELQIGFTLISTGAGRGLLWTPSRLFQQLDTFRFSDFVEVALSDIDSTVAIHSRLRQHNEDIIELRPLLGQFQALGSVPIDSPLLFLGYFGVLESLLTHQPKATDPYESITRQVRTKIALLNRRCQPAIDYSRFGGALPETIWTRMYGYRSVLAHGRSASFDGDLQALGNHRNAFDLLKQSVKAVIRQALIEPQLIADLRDC